MSFAHLVFEKTYLAFATYCVAILCVGLGTVVKAHRPVVAMVAGWGISVFWLVLIGTYTSVGLSWVLLCLGVVGAFMLWWNWQHIDWTGYVPTMVLGLPYMVAAACIVPAGYDEYAHWLANILYLVRFDHFPSLGGPESVSIRPGYPYGMSFIGLAVSRMTGLLAENAVINWNALLCMGVGGLAGELICKTRNSRQLWAAAAIGLLACGICSPAYVGWLQFSNYGDAVTGEVAAVMVGLLLLEGFTPSWRFGALFGSMGMALVLIRQDSLLVFLLIILAWGIALLWRVPYEKRLQGVIALSISVPAPVIVWGLWQHYQAQQLPYGAAHVLSWNMWRWHDLPSILNAIQSVMLRRIGYTLTLILAVCAAFSQRVPAPVRNAAFLGAVIGVGYIAQMIAIYLGVVMGGAPESTAPQFWRLSQHVAPAVVICLTPLLPVSWILASFIARFLPCSVFLIMCGAYPFLRVDTPQRNHTNYTRLRALAQDLSVLIPPHTSLAFVETEELPGEIPEIFALRYRYLALRADTKPSDLYLVAGVPPQVVTVAGNLPQPGGRLLYSLPNALRFVVVTDGGSASSSLVGFALQKGKTYLLQRNELGYFEILNSWAR